MVELVITRGLPASGKTTYAQGWVDEDRAHRARVNRDDLRRMVDDGEFIKGVTEQRIQVIRNAAIVNLLQRGVSVVCDDTNLDNRTCRDLYGIAKRAKAEVKFTDFTHTTLETCLARNAVREDKEPVPQYVLQDMHRKFIQGKPYPLPFTPTSAESRLQDLYEPDESLPRAFICDIDGTVALKGDRNPYDETCVREDWPNPRVIEVVENHIKLGYRPIFLSGRTEGCRIDTWNWLTENIQYDELNAVNDYGQIEKRFLLLMRAVGDNRKDSIVKREIFDRIRHKFNVRFVLDDRDQVVEMWRDELGLTCMQVAPGAF